MAGLNLRIVGSFRLEQDKTTTQRKASRVFVPAPGGASLVVRVERVDNKKHTYIASANVEINVDERGNISIVTKQERAVQ